MKLRFNLDQSQLTLNQLIAMQEGELRVMRDVLARALVDDEGQPIEFEEAVDTIGNLPMDQLQAVVTEFSEQVSVNPQISGT